MKILIIILGLFFFIQINVNGQEVTTEFQPLVVSVGLGDDQLLELENSKLISNDVDWNKVGLYNATYFNEKTQTYFSRSIKITNFNELDRGVGLFHSKFYELINKFNIYNAIPYDDSSYFIFGSIPSNDEPQQTIYRQEYAFICFYNNEELEWIKIFSESYSYISSAVKSSNGIVCLLSQEVDQQSELRLLELSIHGELMRDMEISTPGIEHGYELFFNGEFLFILCTSDSTSGDIEYIYINTLYISVIKVRYDSFLIEDYRCYGNCEYNILKKAFLYNGKIYILFQASGNDGRHQNDDGGYSGHFLVQVDQSFTSEIVNFISVNEYIDDFFITNHNIVFVSHGTKKTQAYLKFNVYTHNLYHLDICYWNYPKEGSRIKNIKSLNNYLGDVVLAIDTHDNMFSGLLSIYDFENYGFAEFNGESFQTINAFFNDEQIMLLGVNDNKFYQTKGYLVETIITNSYQVVSKEYKVRRIKINNFPLNIIGNTKKRNSFGQHRDLLEISFHNFLLFLLDEYYVYEKINIVDGNTYDTGIEISFNGRGLLNDQECLSPIIINTPGEYCLIVYGNSGERKVINFTIKELSLIPNYQEKENIVIDGIEVNKPNYQINKKLNTEVLITDPKTYQFEAIIFAIINSVFLILGMIIWRKK